MTFDGFKKTLGDPDPPQVRAELRALWFAGKGDWDAAHNIAQDIPTQDGSWIHAYLHRVEGDQGNASYWYHRADKPVCKTSLEVEWEQLVAAML